MATSRRWPLAFVALLHAAIGSAGCAREPAAAVGAGPPNFLVIDVDTMSWDHVGADASGVSNTPNIDALARRGTRFTQAFSHAGWTIPELHALLTGRRPRPLHATDGGLRWRSEQTRDVPQVLAYYGYRSVAFFGDTLDVGMAGTLSRHFEIRNAAPRRAPGARPIPSGNPPTADVVRFLESAPHTPFFAFVHDADLHRPDVFLPIAKDDPLAAEMSAAPGADYAELYVAARTARGEEAAQQAVKARYDAVIQQYDERIGRLVGALERTGLAQRTVVVVTSDHGDDFFEHAEADHGLLYDSTIRIPLVIAAPGQAAPGGVVDTVVQGMDLAPTLLALAGAAADVTMDGQSLVPLLDGEPAGYSPGPVLAMSDPCNATWRDQGKKLIIRNPATAHRHWYPAPGPAPSVRALLAAAGVTDLAPPDCTQPAKGAGRPAVGASADDLQVELYDLATDPGEQTNLAAARPDEVVAMLRLLLPALASAEADAATGPRQRLDADQVRRLQQDGYWSFVNQGAPGQAIR